MRIKTFKCESLGGITKKELHLSEGLNVVLGPNEAGKSTMIDGLFSVFFRNSRLKMNNQADRDFANRFRPYPDGDSMKGSVCFDADGNQYEISKEWGARPSAYLNLNGQLIGDENKISEKLKEVLLYGENTYNNIIFAKQKDIKEALGKISNDQETTYILGDLLRKAVMVLDGLSLEKLKIKIDEELNKYQSRWDFLNNRPEGNRGINHPWKNGVGVVLESFYNKETIKKNMEEAQQVEKEYAIAVDNLKKVIEQKTKVKSDIDQYNGIEKDILKRASLEPKKKILEEKINDLKVVAKEFPVKEASLKNRLGEIDRLNNKMKELAAEHDRAKKINDAKQIEKLLDKISLREQEINNKLEHKKNYSSINDMQIKKLEDLQSKISTSKSSMDAATLLVSLNKAPGRVKVIKGLEPNEIINQGVSFSASGYLKVEIENSFELEVRAGQIDFEVLKEELIKATDEFNKIINECKVSSLEEAKAHNFKRKELEKDIFSLQKQIDEFLEGQKIEGLKDNLKELETLKARCIEEIEKEKQELTETNNSILNEINKLQFILDDWKKKYEGSERVIEILAETINLLNNTKEELSKLAPLPEVFTSPEAFMNRLFHLRESQESLNNQEREFQNQYYNIEKRLPEISYEEMRPLYHNAENEFQKKLTRLHHLFSIKKVFEQKREELDANSFDPIINSFSKYLSILTLGNYNTGDINDSLKVGIFRRDNVKLPTELLSAGTYDCVLLALRFGLLEHLFDKRKGFVVLDDCLVNLDPQRKAKAVEIIQEYAKNNQVIFTTCDPETANLVGGNIIAV